MMSKHTRQAGQVGRAGLVTLMLLASGLISEPAAAQDEAPALAIRPFVLASEQVFAARETFEAAFGQSIQPFYGGGLTLVSRDGLYVDLTASRFRKVPLALTSASCQPPERKASTQWRRDRVRSGSGSVQLLSVPRPMLNSPPGTWRVSGGTASGQRRTERVRPIASAAQPHGGNAWGHDDILVLRRHGRFLPLAAA